MKFHNIFIDHRNSGVPLNVQSQYVHIQVFIKEILFPLSKQLKHENHDARKSSINAAYS